MQEPKIKISEQKLENNFLLYLFLKEINSTNGLNFKEINALLEKYYLNKTSYDKIIEIFQLEIDKIKKEDRKINISKLLLKINNGTTLKLFIFALKLLKIKPLLLEEAKINSDIIKTIQSKSLHPLSIEYDEIGKHNAYYTRINGALLSLLFFNQLDRAQSKFILSNTDQYLEELFEEYTFAKGNEVEPNQIFMLMFSESINQSITSKAGISYEDRIRDVLISIGIKKESIKKVHDINDKSSEYDFFFTLNNKSYGIGAKRTLRERYKQFIKTNYSTDIDVMIEITLGLDLRKNIAETITKHNTYLFVADEIYYSRDYLREFKRIFPVSQLTLETLSRL